MKYEELTGDVTSYQYIVWTDTNGWGKPKYKLYKQNEDKSLWINVNNPDGCWPTSSVVLHNVVFAFFNTEEEAKLYIRQQEYGPEAEEGNEDFCCPSCNRRFYGKDPFENDYFDDEPYSVTCFCGEKLDISITTTVKYTVAKKKEKQ